MIRSVLSVVAGIAALTVISFAIEALANPLMIRMFPESLPDSAAISHSLPASLFLFGYMAFSNGVGGYVTAWLAPRSRTRHAMIMGAIEAAITVAAMLASTNTVPMRNWIGVIALTIPAASFGGNLRASRAFNTELV
jgi:hypothetical protein